MKIRLFLLSVLMVLVSTASFSTWEPFGPEGIAANKLCFYLDNHNHMAICHDGGIYVYDPVTLTWTNYPSDLPVLDAYYLNGEEFLVILGCGSDSDGIYSFDPVSGVFELIEYYECPNFIAYDEILQKYYVGFHLGLLTSYDGINWTAIGTFSNRNMVDMAIYQNHLVVSHLDNQYSIWYSGDHGTTWTQSPAGSPLISCLGFAHDSKLYGIFPDMSYSSGLWSSVDWGYTWEVEFWSVNMKCVGFDVMGDVFTGWDENPAGQEEGIARYDPESGNLTFINEGLTSLVINEITYNPWMSAIALFCCTADGAFISFDYVNVNEQPDIDGLPLLQLFPNPASGIVHISYCLTRQFAPAQLQIRQPDGRLVLERPLPKLVGSMEFDTSELSPGIYYVILNCEEKPHIKKLVIL